MAETTIFTDFLTELGVPHTQGYSDKQFENMPFKSLFGLSKLLGQYGVDGEGLELSSPADIVNLDVPFIAHTGGGLVIVTDINGDSVSYMTQGVVEEMPLSEFQKVWSGTVFVAYPQENSCEPEYKEHCRDLFFTKAKKWMLWMCAVALFLYLFISNGIYRHVSTVLLALIDIAGLYLTYLLVQKSLKIKNRVADTMCKALQEGGCDNVLEMKAAKFFGIFSWSEVGFTYFSVSLLTLLIFPQWICYLALCNACCLPFTFWSIWYQKFRAKMWCTLCVSVQCSLWLLFFCYLGGGWFSGAFPLKPEFFVLGVVYLFVLLALNRILPVFDKSSDE